MAKWAVPNHGFIPKQDNFKKAQDEASMWMKVKEQEMQDNIKAAIDNLNEFLEEYENLGGRLTISHDYRAKPHLQFKVEFDD